MDVTQVRQRVQAIADAAPDYEVQHGLEDALHVNVLTMISKQSTDAGTRALARAALETRKIDFDRYTA
jgi:endonuclease III